MNSIQIFVGILICVIAYLLYDNNDKQTRLDNVTTAKNKLQNDNNDKQTRLDKLDNEKIILDNEKIILINNVKKYQNISRFLILYVSILNNYLLNLRNLMSDATENKIRDSNTKYADELNDKYKNTSIIPEIRDIENEVRNTLAIPSSTPLISFK